MGRQSFGVTVRASQNASGKSIFGRTDVPPELQDDGPRRFGDELAGHPIALQCPPRTPRDRRARRLADQIVVPGGEVGMHERDRTQILMSRDVLRTPFDVVRHERDVAPGHLAGELFHLGMVDRDEFVVLPPRHGRVVRDEFEPTLGPAGQAGPATVEHVDLDRLRRELTGTRGEVQRRSTEDLGVRRRQLGHVRTLRRGRRSVPLRTHTDARRTAHARRATFRLPPPPTSVAQRETTCRTPWISTPSRPSVSSRRRSPSALAGLRANEARYFKNKYDHVFTVEPASKAKKTIAWVHRILEGGARHRHRVAAARGDGVRGREHPLGLRVLRERPRRST